MTETINVKKQNIILLAVMLLVGLVPIFNNGYKHEIMYYFFWLFGLLGLLALFSSVTARSFNYSLGLPLLFLVGYVLFAGVSVIWSVDRHESLVQWLYLFFYLLIFLLIVFRLEREDVNKVVKLLFIIGSGISLVGIISFLFLSSTRIYATFVNQNPLGIYLAMLLLLGLALYASREKANPWLMAALVLLGTALVFSGSKGAMVAALPASVFVLMSISKAQFKVGLMRLAAVLILVSLSSFIISSAAPIVQGNLKGQITNIENALTTSLSTGNAVLSEQVLVRSNTFMSITVAGRVSFWETALNIVKDKPLTGVGLGNYHKVYFLYDNDNGWYSKFVHNHYLQTASELGLFGLSLFLGFLITIGYKLWSFHKKAEDQALYFGLLSAVLAFLFHIFIDFSWSMPAVVVNFWVMLGLLVAFHKGQTSGEGEQKSFDFKLKPRYLKQTKMVFAGFILAFLIISGLQYFGERVAEKALAFEGEGSYQEALASYSLATKLNPLNALNYLHLSFNHYMLYQESQEEEVLTSSFEYAKKALELTPYDAYLNNWIARLYYLQKDYKTAEKHLRAAINLSEFKMSYYGDLANYYLSFDERLKAKEVFLAGLSQKEKALFDIPIAEDIERTKLEIINLHLGLAKLYEVEGEFRKAKGQLEAVLAMDSENEIALKVLKSYEDNGRI